ASLKKHLLEHGGKLMLNSTVTGFEQKGKKVTGVICDNTRVNFDELVIAGGSWIPQIASKLGIHILLQAGKGYTMTFKDVPRNLLEPAILVDARTAMTPMGPDLRMGGTMEISGINNHVLIKRARAIFKAANSYYANLPVEFPSVDKIWSG